MLGTSGGTSWASPVYTLADELTIDWINPAISSGTTLLGSAPSTAMKARLGLDSLTDGQHAGSASPKPKARMLGRRFQAGSVRRRWAACHRSVSSVGRPSEMKITAGRYHRSPPERLVW